jgi:hypothetical protein
LSLIPQPLNIDTIRPLDNFTIFNFRNCTIKLPDIFKEGRETAKTKIFVSNDNKAEIVLGLPSPKKLVNDDKEDSYYECFKKILYETKKKDLLSIKDGIIPYVGDGSIEIYDFKIGNNKGFYYKGIRGAAIHRHYDIFPNDNELISVTIVLKSGANLSENEINYIIASIEKSN